MKKQNIVSELWEFMKFRKRYWLFPVVIILLLFGILVILSESSAVAPFIYALF